MSHSMVATALPAFARGRVVVAIDARRTDLRYRSAIGACCAEHLAHGEQPVAFVRCDDASQLEWIAFLDCEILLPELPAPSEPDWLRARVIGRYRTDARRLTVTSGHGSVAECSLPPDSLWDLPARGGMSRVGVTTLVALIALLIAVAAGSFVPAPYVIDHPGRSRDVASIVHTAEHRYKGSGSINYAVVEHGQLNWSELPYWWIRSHMDSEVVPLVQTEGPSAHPDLDLSDRKAAKMTATVATYAAARAANLPVRRARADGLIVLAEAPRLSRLRSGDVIVEADGHKIESMDDLEPILARHEPGDYVPVTTRTGRAAEIYLHPDPSRSSGYFLAPRLQTWGLTFTLDRRPRFSPTFVEGNSAGLAVALYLYQWFSGDDITRGRNIVATGVIETSGRVGLVGGVAEKVHSAADERADIVLVPQQTLSDALRFGPYSWRTRIIGVDSLQDAIRVLKIPDADRER